MRSRTERTVLWAAGIGMACCVLPWYGDPTVWGIQTIGAPAALFGFLGWWLALNWRSPVLIAFALALGALLALFGIGGDSTVTPFPLVAIVAYGTGVVAVVRLAPGR